MRILALLPDSARRALASALAHNGNVSVETDHQFVIRAIRLNQCDAAVIDPSVFSKEDFDELLQTLVTRPTLPVLIYASLTSATAVRVVQIAELGAHELVLRGIDDAPEIVAAKLQTLVTPSAQAMLFNRTASRIRQFPEPLKTAAVSLFCNAPVPRFVNDLTRATGLGRRTIDRWMERTNINGASSLLDTTRLARVHTPLREGKSAAEAASAAGFPRLRLLATHTQRLIGASPDEIRKMSAHDFTGRLAKVLLH